MHQVNQNTYSLLSWINGKDQRTGKKIFDKVLDQRKETTSIVKFDDTKILIDTDNKLPGYINLKIVVTLTTCFIKDDRGVGIGGGWLIYNRVWEGGQGVGIIL